MGPPALFTIRRNVCCGFLSPLKSNALAGLETATFGSSGKHTNHYTTKATKTYFPVPGIEPESSHSTPIFISVTTKDLSKDVIP
jgi:hypothetical protein